MSELLRQYVTLVCLDEAKVGASPDYMRKERVREALQGLITKMVSSGQLKDQQDLDEAFGSLDMSIKALKMIPYEVWQRMVGVNTIAPKKTRR